MLIGSIVALVTPFKKGVIDEDAVRELIEFHIEAGTSGILVAGCTGESFTLYPEERDNLISIAKQQADDRVPILAGTGASSLSVALELSSRARELGADYSLVISPCGNKPSQAAIFDYYTEIAKVAPPMILYNVPGRTGKGIAPETVVQLADNRNIVGIKEASGSIDAVSYILREKPDFAVYSGDDTLTLPMLVLGAKGVICTVANILPKKMAQLVDAYMKGNIAKAQKLHFELFPVINALFIDGNPVPLKEAMSLMGLHNGACRPPLGHLSEENREKLIEVLEEGGFLR